MTMSKIRDLVSGAMLAPYSGSGEGAPKARESKRRNPFLMVLWIAGVALTLIGLLMWGSSDPLESSHSTGWGLMMTGATALIVALVVSAVLWQRDN